jgi:hypothetical protein
MAHTIINRPFTIKGRTFTHRPPWGEVDADGHRLCWGCGRRYRSRSLYCCRCRRVQEHEAAELRRQAKEQRRRDHEAKMVAQRLRRALESGRFEPPPSPVKDAGELVPRPFTCGHCGGEFVPERSTAKFCSLKCRVAVHRAKAKG